MVLKEKLDAFIKDKDAHCFLLNGPWGVGKTYEINRWERGISGYKVIHLSLFGISSVEELNSLALNSEGFSNRFKSYIKSINQDVSVGVGPVTLSLPLIGLVANLMSQKHESKSKYLFIMDDIERKDSKLEIADVFGFVDSLPKKNTKVVLIANEKEIKDGDLIGFKEKVVQYEHHLVSPSDEAITEIFGRELPNSIRISNLRTLKYVKKIIDALNKEVNNTLVKAIFLCSLCIKEGKYSRDEYINNYEADAKSLLPFIDKAQKEKELAEIDAKVAELRKEKKDDHFYLFENIKLLNLLDEIKESRLRVFVYGVYSCIFNDDYSALNNIEIPLKESPFKTIKEKGGYIFLSNNPNKEYTKLMHMFSNIFKTDDYNLLDTFINMGRAISNNESLAKHNSFNKGAERKAIRDSIKPVANYIFNHVNIEEIDIRLSDPFITNNNEWLVDAKTKIYNEYCRIFNNHYKSIELSKIDELKNKLHIMRNVFNSFSVDKSLIQLDNIILKLIKKEISKSSKQITEEEWRCYHKIGRFINDEKEDFIFDKSIEFIKTLSKKKGIIGYRFSILNNQYFE